MAKQEAGYMGGFRGTLGTAVGYSWRGTWVMRSKPGRVANPRTDKQMQHRELFKRMVQTAARMRGAVAVGLRDESRKMHMTEYNLFVNRNNDCFSLADNELVVDYERLQLSGGPVAPVEFGDMVIDDLLTGHIDFIKNPLHQLASPDDVVYVYAYCQAKESGAVVGMATRRTKRVNICLPTEWAGLEVHLYGFVTDAAGRASSTCYIGHGPVAPYHTDAEEDSDTDDTGGTADTAVAPLPSASPQTVMTFGGDSGVDGPPVPE